MMTLIPKAMMTKPPAPLIFSIRVGVPANQCLAVPATIPQVPSLSTAITKRSWPEKSFAGLFDLGFDPQIEAKLRQRKPKILDLRIQQQNLV